MVEVSKIKTYFHVQSSDCLLNSVLLYASYVNPTRTVLFFVLVNQKFVETNFREKNIYIIYRPCSVRIVTTLPSVLNTDLDLRPRYVQVLGQSVSRYGPPSRLLCFSLTEYVQLWLKRPLGIQSTPFPYEENNYFPYILNFIGISKCELQATSLIPHKVRTI